jgi:hypothetical protein
LSRFSLRSAPLPSQAPNTGSTAAPSRRYEGQNGAFHGAWLVTGSDGRRFRNSPFD